MTDDLDTRATTRWLALEEELGPPGPRDTVGMPALQRPATKPVPLPNRPRWDTGETRAQPITRPAFERGMERVAERFELAVADAVSRVLNRVSLLMALFAVAMAFTAWLVR